MIERLVIGICMGVAATATMDLLASASRRLGLTVGAKGTWVGRWYLGIARGQLVHADITATAELPGEKGVALVGHYLIGIVLALFYLVGAHLLGISPAAFFPALSYGFSTCIFPWFLLFPALGFGWFGLKGPPELKLISTSVVNHLFYGFGLWWSAQVLTRW